MEGIRKSVGEDFLIIFRIPAMDMLEGGMSWEEICTLGQALENSGVSIVSTHFSWHESPVPTIATMVPRAAFTSVTKRLKSVINVPVITSNRINMPDVAETVLANGDADLVSMARPFLADGKIFEKIKIKDIKTICVGNIYLGGTGKTSLAIKIKEILTKKNIKTCFVKKFYKLE